MSLRPPMKYRAANRDFSTGDAVRHTISGEVAVVVERLGRNRLVRQPRRSHHDGLVRHVRPHGLTHAPQSKGSTIMDNFADSRYADNAYAWQVADEAGHAAMAQHYAETCGAEYVTGGSDPYSTDCDQTPGHSPTTPHAADDPMGGGGRIEWRGGGSAGGDALPYRDVRWIGRS